MAVTRGDRLGEEICEVLRIDSSQVQELSLTIRAGAVAMLTIHRYVTTDDGAAIKKALECYKVEPA